MGVKLVLSHELRLFENRILRNIFGPKKEDVTREWRRLHNEELYEEKMTGNQGKLYNEAFLYFCSYPTL
jgi:hypothetical protein